MSHGSRSSWPTGSSAGTLRFTDDLKGASAASDMVIVAVGTHDGNGGWQTDTVRGALADIVPAMGDTRRS
jgi:UDP-glucose 6-dehydrogenase